MLKSFGQYHKNTTNYEWIIKNEHLVPGNNFSTVLIRLNYKVSLQEEMYKELWMQEDIREVHVHNRVV